MSGRIRPFQKDKNFNSTVGEISLYSAIGYLVTKIVTSVNPLAGAIYIGSITAIRMISFDVFNINGSFFLAIVIGSIPIAAYFANIAILKALIIGSITTVALLSLEFLRYYMASKVDISFRN